MPSQGDIVLVPVLFTDLSSARRRPLRRPLPGKLNGTKLDFCRDVDDSSIASMLA
jgi:hypothetical protein